jgi:pimeloyl-ACP methyl ester carboxylesterase
MFALWRRHRARVRSLIFCSTKVEADTTEGKQGRENTAALVREKGLEALHDQLGPKMLGPKPSDEVRSRVREMFLRLPPEVAAADALAMRDRPDSTADLASIDVPALWVHGAQDALMPVDGARATAGKIPTGRFVAIDEAGHMAPLEQPAAANAAMTSFLKEVS